jgi:hypothetical protein
MMCQCSDANGLASALFSQHRVSEIAMSSTALCTPSMVGDEAAVAFGCRPMISTLTDAEKDPAGSQPLRQSRASQGSEQAARG